MQLSVTRQRRTHDVMSPMLPAGAAACSDGAATSFSPVETAPMFASPGVYAAETSGRYSSLPQESSLESPIGSPGNGRGNFASADAARVGGGLYGHLLDALCTLATDPAPSVARMGKAVLLLAGVQITPVMGSPGDLLSCLPAIPKQSSQSQITLPWKSSEWQGCSEAQAPRSVHLLDSVAGPWRQPELCATVSPWLALESLNALIVCCSRGSSQQVDRAAGQYGVGRVRQPGRHAHLAVRLKPDPGCTSLLVLQVAPQGPVA